MKKYLALYHSSVPTKDWARSVTPEQQKASMQAWGAWIAKFGPAIVDMGAPVGASALLAGTDRKDHVAGYSIVQAGSLDAAKLIFEKHPHFEAPDASIQLLELLSMPAM